LKVVAPQYFEQLHAGFADLAVVACLLDDAAVGVSNATGPAVVARLAVLLPTLRDHPLGLVERRCRCRDRDEAGSLLGDGVL